MIIEILTKIKQIAENISTINQAEIGDIYDTLNNNGHIKYPIIIDDIINVTGDDESKQMNFLVSYADRTLQDNSNCKIIQSDAEVVLTALMIEISNEIGQVESWSFTPFEQKFNDYCAGGQMQLTVNIPVDECIFNEI